MKSISLQEHINQSRIAAAANRAKGNRHGQILSMLYSDPYHFVEELIQNAEDAIARRKNESVSGFVKIIISETGISFFHNGDPFSETDLMAITTFASTTKKGLPGINQIGKFGIGFRSVYGITDNPEIHSGDFHYRITDFEVLEECNPRDTETFTTLIYLPFKSSVSADFRQTLQNRICTLNPTFLLFLNQIQQIEIIAENQSVVINATTELCEKKITHKTIVSSNNGIRNELHFLLMQRNSGHNHKAAIALQINESGHFIPIRNPQVSVYFPTQFHITHSIIVHGSFTTTPNRENIPFSEEWTPENYAVLSVISDLMRILLRSLLNKKIITADFWSLFSWNSSSEDPVSAVISECLNKFIAQEKCLPDQSGKLQSVSGLCVSEDDNLIQLIAAKDIVNVYGRSGFLHHEITDNEIFVSFLRKSHKLKVADIDSFAFHIASQKEFLQKKRLTYFPSLYRFLALHPRLWDHTHKGRYYNLRHKAIIPDKGKHLTAPFSDNDKPQIFIGKAASGFSVVHPELSSNANCMNFFSMLGIPDFAPGLSEANILFKRFKEKTASVWWHNLYEIYASSEASVKDHIREKTNELNCLHCIDSQSGNKIFVQPQQAYLADEHLTAFLSGQQSFFVNPQLIAFMSDQNIAASSFGHFLTELGVNAALRIVETESQLDDNHKSALRAGYEQFSIVHETITDWTIEGLDSFLISPKPASAAALWHLLGKVDEKHRKACYTFESYVRSETIQFSPTYIEKLKTNAWLFDEHLNAVSPQGFQMERLHESFNQSKPASLWMAAELGMITENISSEEKEILSLIRTHRLNTELLQQLLDDTKNDVEFFQYLPMSEPASIAKNTMNFSTADLSAIIQSNPFYANNSQSWDQYLFEEKTQILKNHFLNTVLSASKQSKPYIAKPGHLQIKQNEIIKAHYFTGIRPDAGEEILLPSSFANHFKNESEKKDTGLFVFNLHDKTCIEVSPDNLAEFLNSHSIAFIKTTK